MKIMLFTGAGASKALGFPTTQDFTNHIVRDKEVSDLTLLQDLKKFLTNNHQPTDVETILWFIDKILDDMEGTKSIEFCLRLFLTRDVNSVGIGGGTYNTGNFSLNDQRFQVIMENFKNHREDFLKLKTELEDAVFKYYKLRNNTPQETFNYYQPLLNRIKRYNKSNEIPFFTTNYDMSIESIFKTKKYQQQLSNFRMLDGFDETASRFDDYWNPDHYKITDTSKCNILFYKLHGSLHYRKKNGRIVPNYHEELSANRGNHAVIYPGFKGNPEGEIYEYPHDKLQECLAEADVCIAIGFAFRDEHINEKFNAALKSNADLKIFILLPNELPSDSGIEIDGKRIKLLEGKFGEKNALKLIGDSMKNVV